MEEKKCVLIVDDEKNIVNILKFVRIGYRIRKSALPDIVHTDSQHEEIQPFLDHPVNFLLPVLKRPMFSLKPF